MEQSRYSAPAMALHWVQAILIVWLFWLGWTMLELPKGGPERSAAFALHKSLGLLALLLVTLRLVWRRITPPPPLVGDAREVRLAKAVHHVLYLLLLLLPLAGYLSSSFTEYPMRFFGIELPKFGWPDKGLNKTFKEAHEFLAWSVAVLAGLHVAAALLHGFRGDGTLSRMLPGRTRR